MAPVEQHLHLLHSVFFEAVVGECFLSASYVLRLFLFDLFSCMVRFLFLRIQDFGQNGGAALQALDPKFELFRKNVNEMFNINFSLPQDVEVCPTTTSFKQHSTLWMAGRLLAKGTSSITYWILATERAVIVAWAKFPRVKHWWFLLDVGLQTKHLLMAAIVLEGLGGLLFTLGSSLGAYLLVSM